MSGKLFWCDLIILERFSLLHWSQQQIVSLRKFLPLLKDSKRKPWRGYLAKCRNIWVVVYPLMKCCCCLILESVLLDMVSIEIVLFLSCSLYILYFGKRGYLWKGGRDACNFFCLVNCDWRVKNTRETIVTGEKF